MFHYKDGLFFGRNEDGSVKIRKMRDATGSAALVAEMDIDPDGWASIVASVSAEVDLAVAQGAMREFHMEGILRAPVTGTSQSEMVIHLADQIDRLAKFILNEVPGEPSESAGAVDTAIRLMREFYVERAKPLPMTREAFVQFVRQMLGEVSMCWDPRPAGVFNPEAVAVLGDRIVDFILGPVKINAEPVPDEVFGGPVAPPPNVVGSPPPGAELKQPTEGEGKSPEGS